MMSLRYFDDPEEALEASKLTENLINFINNKLKL